MGKRGKEWQRSGEKPFNSRKRPFHALLCREITRMEVRWEIAEITGGNTMLFASK